MRTQETPRSSALNTLHPVLGMLLRYWLEKRGDRVLPARRDIDPLEMGPELLPHLLLTDLLDRGTRLRFRLVGTNLVKRLGCDPTGGYLAGEMTGGWFDSLAAWHRLVYCERAPVQAESEFTWNGGRRVGVEHLLLPLTQDGPDPAIALGAFVFASGEAFPPTVRMLASCASHAELQHLVLKDLPPSPPGGLRAGREVA